MADAEGSLIYQDGMSQKGTSQSQSEQRKNGGSQSDSSSDLIRWRADQLLDEMMLGAVDVSAADHVTDHATGRTGDFESSSDHSAAGRRDSSQQVHRGLENGLDESSTPPRTSPASPPTSDTAADSHVTASDIIPENDVHTHGDDSYSNYDNRASTVGSDSGNVPAGSDRPSKTKEATENPSNEPMQNGYYNMMGNGRTEIGHQVGSPPSAPHAKSVPSEPKWMEDDWRSPADEDGGTSRDLDNPATVMPDSAGKSLDSGSTLVGKPDEATTAEARENLFSSALSGDLSDLRAPSLNGENLGDDVTGRSTSNGIGEQDGESNDSDATTDVETERGRQESEAQYRRTEYENFSGERPASGGGESAGKTERRSWDDSTLPRVQSGGGLSSSVHHVSSASGSGAGQYDRGAQHHYGVATDSNHAGTEDPGNTNFAEPARADNVDDSGAAPAGVYASPMSVASMGKKLRSTLLPRMSKLDVESLNQEILTLHEEIRDILPIGHETAERARHLLDKAHTILHSDPMRSAEVEYYMQQVRAIVQRVRQTHRWSNVYRSRLQLYLSAWALLSLVVLSAQLLLPVQFELFWMALTGSEANSTLVHHLPVVLATLLTGAMGGAVGALYTMFQHARSEYGFFDRKYGLRGIMLPIIGAMVGVMLYGLFAILSQILGMSTTSSLAFGILPALLALIFGLGQESLYGTRS